MALHQRIKVIRLEKKLTQKEFADMLFVSPSYISKLESGKEQPTDMLLRLIELEFNITPQWLRSGEGEAYASKAEHDPYSRHEALQWYESLLEMQAGLSILLTKPEYSGAILNASTAIMKIIEALKISSSIPFNILVFSSVVTQLIETVDTLTYIENSLRTKTMNTQIICNLLSNPTQMTEVAEMYCERLTDER